MESFDILKSPLTGTCLIEASAGTGKTYTLEGLVIRLIVISQLPIEQILVVTFTNNAVEELKSRIRKKLLLVKSNLKGVSSDDFFVQKLSQEITHPFAALEKINHALVDFDQAAIYTIHGFCQRILSEQAFETNTSFASEITPDTSAYIKEIANDFWRSHFYNAPPEIVGHAIAKLDSPEYFSNLYNRFFHPDAHICPSSEAIPMPDPEPYREVYQKVKAAWEREKILILPILEDPVLNGKIYGGIKTDHKRSPCTPRQIKLASLSKEMDVQFLSGRSRFPLFQGFALFSQTKITNSTHKNKISPFHDFFVLCDELLAAFEELTRQIDQFLISLEHDFFRYAGKMLKAGKKQDNVLSFDDLLVMVRDALNQYPDKQIKQVLRKKYKAVLVDEFQDTDSIQYDIFSTVFSGKYHSFYMIGDPKQAIYSFRGADIFSYMKAVDDTESRFTLEQNWRSTPDLITAVNTVFSNQSHSFLYDKIPFEPVSAGKKSHPDAYDFGFPLTIWHLFSSDDPENTKPLSSEQATDIISNAVANEIVNISQQPPQVALKDIAVLVRTNRQANIIRRKLSGKNIPAVVYYSGNIFDTPEAMELQRILWALADQGNERKIKAALATQIMGTQGRDFEPTQGFDFWENRVFRMQEYALEWRRHGFMRMFRRVLAEEKIKQRLIVFTDGERSLTNLLHLAELLHQADMEKHPGVYGLVKWLAEKRQNQTMVLDEHLLRLDKDELAVKIVTIHKSKGLEYPVVFCPFGWESSLVPDKPALRYHDPDRNNELVVDLGSDQFAQNRNLAQREKLAENLRLYYVAMTRAKQKCYLAWGRVKNADTSAPAFLFHYPKDREPTNDPNIIDKLQNVLKDKNDNLLCKDLKHLTELSSHAIELVELTAVPEKDKVEEAETKENYHCKKFSGVIDASWKITSYSHLAADHYDAKQPLDMASQAADRDRLTALVWPDFDETEKPEEPSSNYSDIVFFPKGAHAGLFFHDLFENLDFTLQDTDYRKQLIDVKTKQYGISSDWAPALIQMIDNVTNASLLSELPALTLSAVSLENRINEMEFEYPINKITPQVFKDLVLQNTPPDLAEMAGDQKFHFSAVHGIMKGFIDLIFCYQNKFYILDWKSNYLGQKSMDYSQENIGKAMIEHKYNAQYLIYTLALNRYLSLRMADYDYHSHFGGVFYLFIRGITSEKGPDFGIFYDRPDYSNLQDMEADLLQ